MAASHRLILLVLCLAAAAGAASAHNITAILDGRSEYTLYNSYLSETKVCDEINSRSSVTVLVLPNGAMSSLVANLSLADIKSALRLLTLLDYFDEKKLHSIGSGSQLTTSLYQTTGQAAGDMGHVNITDLRGGKVAFASAAPGAKFQSTYTKRVADFPSNLSVLEVSDPITFPGLFGAPPASSANLTDLLEKAGCKQFARLIVSSGVVKTYQAAMDKGLTLFAPNDDAFKAKGLPDLSKLTSADLVALLQYHALPQYAPKASLKVAATGRIPTLASTGAGKYDLTVASSGDEVSLDTGVDKSRVASTVLDAPPTVILTVDSVLLPHIIFGGAPSPAPAPEPAAADVPASAPAPEGSAPAPAPKSAAGKKKKKGKSPSHSPPAPPADSPDDMAPADAPADDAAADKVENKKNGAAAVATVSSAASAALAAVAFLLL